MTILRLSELENAVKARKLHGRMEFQGLPISIENRAGSRRYWYDPNADEHGSTKMKYPYGYIRGTLGLDGDEVDVFVGPNESSTKVFIITQLKRPEFTEVDEQKIMLGFTSAASAKEAYLKHYNDPRFFGSMKEISIEEFKEKLIKYKGKLIKHLFLADTSANIQRMDKSFRKDDSMAEKCNHPKDEKCDSCKDAVEILKGLTARMLSMMKRHTERPVVETETTATPDPEFTTQEVQMFSVPRPFEPPTVPTAHIATPAQAASPLAPDFMTACEGCGYIHKSISACPRCEAIANISGEALPIWRR